MRRTILLVAGLMIAALSASAISLPWQQLNYRVVYHLGFINKTAGHGSVQLSANDGYLSASLHGQSIPWGGKLYTVNDTLRASFADNAGAISERVQYAVGWYSKPEVGVTESFASNPGGFKSTTGLGSLNADAATIEAVTITTDMLGLYYVAHVIDFDSLSFGKVITIPIDYEGSHKILQITYQGKTEYQGADAYSIVFNYSYDGSLSAYPVNCMIAADSRIPLMLSADLIIGHMEMIYEP